MLQREILEEKQITDNLKVSISVSLNRDKIYIDVDYLDGKFTIQKNFDNNYIGLELLEEEKKKFNNEKVVKEYFKL